MMATMDVGHLHRIFSVLNSKMPHFLRPGGSVENLRHTAAGEIGSDSRAKVKKRAHRTGLRASLRPPRRWAEPNAASGRIAPRFPRA